MKKIYVGNFSFSTTEAELRQWFEPYGAVESATVVTDRDTGRSRGFGFVEMADNAAADAAIAALNGQDNGGRALTVNEASVRAAAVEPAIAAAVAAAVVAVAASAATIAAAAVRAGNQHPSIN